ncbi:MAG TPA: hypothetical protein VK177_19175 [Flavobacteriales bacterium]|nr:hypothetical protein [Flavobacteriales bacterium]
MKNLLLTCFVLIAGIGISHAQCKGFAKKKCLPDMKPYATSGKINATTMRPGDKAELMVTFNSDVEYRLMVCGMDNIKVSFKVMDTDKNVFFDSEKNKKNYFDFNVASTQQLIVEINCEDKDSLTGITPEGCISILTGTKSKK